MTSLTRFETMAYSYDQAAPYCVPQYERMQDEALSLIPFPRDKPFSFIDLGAGSGHLASKILIHWPLSHGICFDSSEPFLALARKRLAEFGDRAAFLAGDYAQSWAEAEGKRFDLVISSHSIHHQDARGKKLLYARCFEALTPGGILINLDEMRNASDGAYLADMRYWVDHVAALALSPPEGAEAAVAEFASHFALWKKRNVDGFGSSKGPGDDIHDPGSVQARWLGEIGFVDAGIFASHRLWSVLAGRKP
jgi:tRNA (cmo5U34)-methyltransferase